MLPMFSQDFASLLLGLLCTPALLRPSFFRIQKNQKKLSTYPLLKNETAKNEPKATETDRRHLQLSTLTIFLLLLQTFSFVPLASSATDALAR